MTETTTNISVSLQTETSEEFEGIQIKSINVGNSYTVGAVSLDDRAITIIAKGVRNVLDGIEPTAIKAQVDLSGYGPGTHEVPVIVYIDDIRVTLIPKVSTVKVKVVSKG